MPDDFLDDIADTPALAQVPATGTPPTGAPPATQVVTTGTNLEEMELAAILRSLEANGGNVSATARALGVSRNTIYRKLPHLK